jgi:hypothetical protein
LFLRRQIVFLNLCGKASRYCNLPLLQWTGDGVSGNAEFDLIIALGVGVGVTSARMETAWLARYIRANYLRDMMLVMLLVRLVATDRQESALVLLSPEFRSRSALPGGGLGRGWSMFFGECGRLYAARLCGVGSSLEYLGWGGN